MRQLEATIGPTIREPHEAEIDAQTVVAFWRLGRALEGNLPRDREVFALGRCLGATTGVPSVLVAYSESGDPAAFAMSKLIYGGDQPMLDAYWQSAADPAVFQLARAVFRLWPSGGAQPGDHVDGGVLVFDVSEAQARLAGIRFAASE